MVGIRALPAIPIDPKTPTALLTMVLAVHLQNSVLLAISSHRFSASAPGASGGLEFAHRSFLLYALCESSRHLLGLGRRIFVHRLRLFLLLQ